MACASSSCTRAVGCPSSAGTSVCVSLVPVCGRASGGEHVPYQKKEGSAHWQNLGVVRAYRRARKSSSVSQSFSQSVHRQKRRPPRHTQDTVRPRPALTPWCS